MDPTTLSLVPRIIYAALLFILAAFLLINSRRNRATLAFALLSLNWGFITGISGLRQLYPDPTNFWTRVYGYFFMLDFFILFYFISVFPKQRRWLPRGTLSWLPFALGALLVDAAYFFDHSLFLDFNEAALPRGLLLELDVISFALHLAAPLVLLRDWQNEPNGARKSTIHLVGLALSLGLFFVVGAAAKPFVGNPLELGGGTVWALWTRMIRILLAAWLIWSLAVIVRVATEEHDRRAALTYFLLLIPPFLSGYLLTDLAGTLSTPVALVGNVINGVWNLALPLLVTYALLRHRLFEIDVKIKWGIKRGTLAAIFLAVFFVVAQVAQTYLTGEYGLVLGGISAGLLLFALAPLQRFAERVADAAMPGVKSVNELTHPERLALYREQARAAWADGVLDKSERNLLDNLRTRLGLSEEEAHRLEREAASPAG